MGPTQSCIAKGRRHSRARKGSSKGTLWAPSSSPWLGIKWSKTVGPGIHFKRGSTEVVVPPEVPPDSPIRQVFTPSLILGTGLKVLGGSVNYLRGFEFAEDAFTGWLLV